MHNAESILATNEILVITIYSKGTEWYGIACMTLFSQSRTILFLKEINQTSHLLLSTSLVKSRLLRDNLVATIWRIWTSVMISDHCVIIHTTMWMHTTMWLLWHGPLKHIIAAFFFPFIWSLMNQGKQLEYIILIHLWCVIYSCAFFCNQRGQRRSCTSEPSSLLAQTKTRIAISRRTDIL